MKNLWQANCQRKPPGMLRIKKSPNPAHAKKFATLAKRDQRKFAETVCLPLGDACQASARFPNFDSFLDALRQLRPLKPPD